jgi:hypothetical protein
MHRGADEGGTCTCTSSHGAPPWGCQRRGWRCARWRHRQRHAARRRCPRCRRRAQTDWRQYAARVWPASPPAAAPVRRIGWCVIQCDMLTLHAHASWTGSHAFTVSACRQSVCDCTASLQAASMCDLSTSLCRNLCACQARGFWRGPVGCKTAAHGCARRWPGAEGAKQPLHRPRAHAAFYTVCEGVLAAIHLADTEPQYAYPCLTLCPHAMSTRLQLPLLLLLIGVTQFVWKLSSQTSVWCRHRRSPAQQRRLRAAVRQMGSRMSDSVSLCRPLR